jgi:hypothetical protein
MPLEQDAVTFSRGQRKFHEWALAIVTRALDPEEFDRMRAEGRPLNLDQATSLAFPAKT